MGKRTSIRLYKSGDAKGINEMFTKHTPYLRDDAYWTWINRIVGYDILSADIARNAHYIRSNTMGIFVAAQVGRSVGEVANPLFDSSFLRSHALLRRFLRPVAV